MKEMKIQAIQYFDNQSEYEPELTAALYSKSFFCCTNAHMAKPEKLFDEILLTRASMLASPFPVPLKTVKFQMENSYANQWRD